MANEMSIAAEGVSRNCYNGVCAYPESTLTWSTFLTAPKQIQVCFRFRAYTTKLKGSK